MNAPSERARLSRQVYDVASYHKMRPLSRDRLNKLVDTLAKVSGDPVTFPDIYVLYRLTERGILD